MEQFLKAVGGNILQKGEDSLCTGISTDTRTLRKGEFFFALRGPHFDGNRFCSTAFSKGAWGAVIDEPLSKKGGGGFAQWVVEVKDALTALGDLAKWWRSRFDIPTVAVTGSNGKTTVKEMIASILATKWKTLKTEGNFNNLIGLPLTLNRLSEKHEAAVLEMGMNAFGEIKRLTEIAQPTVGLVTNAAAAHLEKLGNVESVAKAKSELYETMSPASVAVYNAEDPFLRETVHSFSGKKIAFGMSADADVLFDHMESTTFDTMDLKLRVGGKILETRMTVTGIHNVMNAMAACAVAHALGFSADAMREGLESFTPMKMRFEQIQLTNGVRLVNDAYNANPVSMEAAFKTVSRAKRAGRFIAVLGDMKELGDEAPLLHEEVGKKGVEYGVERLFLIGDFAQRMAKGAKKGGLAGSAVTISQSKNAITELLEKEIRAGDIILIKASRAMQLETIAEALKETFGD